MTISIWRYSHLTLAISSALFIGIATITGIILAFEPISNQLKLYNQVDLETVSIAETITALQQEYDEIVSFAIDENDFVQASVITKEGKSASFYINPKTGKKIGEIIQKKPIFEFATNLHRSLFLKSTGRFLVGFFSFLLFLIAVTGTILIAKRQGGFTKIFTKIVKEDFNQYYHIVFGRWFLIPLIIITLTGVYLSLEKFSWLPKDKKITESFTLNTNLKKDDITNFEHLTTSLDDIKKVEFPFSDDAEDYFFVSLDDKEVAIHQFTGQIVHKKQNGLVSLLSNYSLILHTGQGSIVWSLILLFSCFSILFFMFSGFSMTVNRRKNTVPFKNVYDKNEAEFIILLGSETGSTLHFAKSFFNALIHTNKKVYFDELNNYTTYKKAKDIIIFTATYGDGDAPVNANNFLKKVATITPENSLNFSVLGFGSTNYPEFCKFAILVQANLQIHDNFTPLLPLFKVNNQSYSDFNSWLQQWKTQYKIDLQIDKNQIKEPKKKQQFKVTKKSTLNVDDTFLIELKPLQKVKFTSGDLIAIIPKNKKTPRLYSIAKVGKNIVLSVKKHEFGVCSNFLNSLAESDIIKANIQQNEKFHFPKRAKEVILIANGTGIAPYLGMIAQNKKREISLFWGGRTQKSLEIYRPYLNKALQKNLGTSFEAAYSQEHQQKVYVQDLIKNYNHLIADFLKNGNIILICGSLSMQKGIEIELEKICKTHLNQSLQEFKNNNQIKTDCY